MIDKILDRYTPAEIVEKLEITDEDFKLLFTDYVMEHLEYFEDDLEEFNEQLELEL